MVETTTASPRPRRQKVALAALIVILLLTTVLSISLNGRVWTEVGAYMEIDGREVSGRAWRSPEGTYLLDVPDNGQFVVSPAYNGMLIVGSDEVFAVGRWAVWKSLPPRGFGYPSVKVDEDPELLVGLALYRSTTSPASASGFPLPTSPEV